VLWVVNTVKRCQKISRALKEKLGDTINVGVYHSRFKLQDRQRRHRETVDAFRAPTQGECPAAIAVTTQVCEMSLDLDADLLITEHAPVSSLVQRFGRANRHLRRGPDFRATLLTYAPESNLPYDKKELEAADNFLANLPKDGVSQRCLALALEKYALVERDASGSSAFIDGGYFATRGELRDNDDVGVAVVLDRDLVEFKRLAKARLPTDGLTLTVPKRHAREIEDGGLPPWIKTADSSSYDEWLGFYVADEQDSSTGLHL
jgi:CRISPR-associated endonuclease/helicase Cas3